MTEDSQLKNNAWHQFQNTNYRAAAKIYIQLLKKYPQDTKLMNILSLCLSFIKKPNFAIRLMQKALSLSPDDISLLNNLGALYIAQKKIDHAIKLYENAINKKIAPQGARDKLIQLYLQKKNYKQVLVHTEALLKKTPDDQQLLTYKGIALVHLMQYKAGYDILIKQLEHHKNNIKFLYCLAVAAYNSQHFSDAINFFSKCIQSKPKNPIYWNNLGIALKRLVKRNFRKEVKCFKKAIKLDPDNISYYYNLANTLINADKLHLSEKILKTILHKKPEFLEAIISYGYLNQLIGKHEEAKSCYQKAIKLDPNTINAHTNLGFLLLTDGDFNAGLKSYEWRWKHPDLNDIKEKFTDNRWQGESLNNKTLMIFTEQGYGDTIQFVRYIPLINKGNGKIILECRPALIGLLETVSNIDSFVTNKKPFPKHDYYIPLLSLPILFKTTLNNIPQNMPYLNVNQVKNKQWHDYFSHYKKQFNIGIVWAGNPKHRNDHYRSIKPRYFSQLKINTQVNLFSLQLENNTEVCQKYKFISLANQIKDFTDTAAIVNNLDLIISVDTSIVHLAGALNKPVWTILGAYNDWRWLRNRTDSPWYPSMYLFRQPKKNQWQPVFDTIIKKLSNHLT